MDQGEAPCLASANADGALPENKAEAVFATLAAGKHVTFRYMADASL
jgi:hypothetical protein